MDKNRKLINTMINNELEFTAPSKSFFFFLISYLLLILPLFAQPSPPEDFYNDFDLTYTPPQPEKSAALAMAMSAIFPGAGQFYVNPKSPTAYIFPAIEIVLWYMLYDYDRKGDKKEREYERFADKYYSYQRYEDVYHIWGNPYPTMAGDWEQIDGYLNNNLQQYYECIGKYDKFIFGWEDWYQDNVGDGNRINWYLDENGGWFPGKGFWTGDDETNAKPPTSNLRKEYVRMRIQAEKYYDKSRSMGFFILANHALATFDANRLARKHNRQSGYASIHTPDTKLAVSKQKSPMATEISINPEIKTAFINDHIVPMVNLNVRF